MKHEFIAELKKGQQGGFYVDIPFDVEKEFGSKRPKIKAKVQGIEYRGLLARMKTPHHILIIIKAIREKLSVGEGDMLPIEIQKDIEERLVGIPGDFKTLLLKEKLLPYFESLAFTHRKEFVRWIEEAKKAETRQRRLEKAIEMLKNKINLS